MMHFLIKACEQLARIPEPLGRVFLHKARTENDAVAGRFEKRVKLPKRDLPLLRWSEIKRMAFAHAGVSLALTPSPSRTTVQLSNAVIKLLDFFFARKLTFFRWRPASFIK